MISVLALFSSFMLNIWELASLPAWLSWLGLAVAVAGVLFRWWANRALGAFYTRTLKIAEGQTTVQVGPYRVIRILVTWA